MKFFKILLSFFSRTANIFFWILLMLAGLAAYLNPSSFWLLGVLGLAYPILAAINIFFLISWILRKRAFFILSLTGLILTYPQLKPQWKPALFSPSISTDYDLRVMSYNVRNFDLYNWTKNEHSKKSMMDTIQKYAPDILMMQEYYTDENKHQNTKYLSSIGYPFQTVAVELIKKRTRMWGVAVFSKHPILNSGEIIKMNIKSPYGNYHYRGAYVDVQIDNQIIRAISIHLQSIHFAEEDYDTLEDIKKDPTNKYYKIPIILSKLKRAFKERGNQVDELKEFIQNSPYPVILGGDFNDTPASYSYQQIKQVLDDAYIKKGQGISRTYNGIIPFLRIDYIFADKSFECVNFQRNKNPNSDHFPIIADYNLSKK